MSLVIRGLLLFDKFRLVLARVVGVFELFETGLFTTELSIIFCD